MWDLGGAAAQMMLVAWELGIGSLPGDGLRARPRARDPGLPGRHAVRARPLVRLPGRPGVLTAPLRPGGRRPQDELVYEERWGASATPGPRGRRLEDREIAHGGAVGEIEVRDTALAPVFWLGRRDRGRARRTPPTRRGAGRSHGVVDRGTIRTGRLARAAAGPRGRRPPRRALSSAADRPRGAPAGRSGAGAPSATYDSIAASRPTSRPARSDSSHLCSRTSQYAWTRSRSGPTNAGDPGQRRPVDLAQPALRRLGLVDLAPLVPLQPGVSTRRGR